MVQSPPWAVHAGYSGVETGTRLVSRCPRAANLITLAAGRNPADITIPTQGKRRYWGHC